MTSCHNKVYCESKRVVSRNSMLRNRKSFNKRKPCYRNFIPALKLRTKSIEKIVDNRDKFSIFSELIQLKYADVRNGI